mmetsp:Transcript_6612/g.16026  ORF Transcript_6612/g.16026 Transcript_6612/m.16026 type:complete len:156 (+) Transcript_6612:2-469(+)
MAADPPAPPPLKAPHPAPPSAGVHAAGAAPSAPPTFKLPEPNSLQELHAEEDFLKTFGENPESPPSVLIHVKAPASGPAEYQLSGQTISLEVPLQATVGALKATLAGVTKVPSNKQKLQLGGLGFLKDGKTLAFYNVRDAANLVLELKERGGKKK